MTDHHEVLISEVRMGNALVNQALAQVGVTSAILNVSVGSIAKWLPKAAPTLIAEAQRERYSLARTLAELDAAIADAKKAHAI